MLTLYRRLLVLLPDDMREQYGEEMLGVVREQWAGLGPGRGAWRSARFWARQLWALLRAAVQLRVGGDRAHADGRHPVEGREGKGPKTGGGGMEGLAHDVRQSIRALRKRPGFTFVTAVTLGLGIGASTAIFSAVHAVLFRDLPYGDPDRIVVLLHENVETGERGSGFSPANARDLRVRSELLSEVAVADPWSLDYEVEGRTESLRAWAVSEGFFEAFGVEPILGRSFTAEEHVGPQPVVILGYRSWQARFGGDLSLVGRTLTFRSRSMTVVGVLGPDFKLPDEAEVWVPRAPMPYDEQQRSHTTSSSARATTGSAWGAWRRT